MFRKCLLKGAKCIELAFAFFKRTTAHYDRQWQGISILNRPQINGEGVSPLTEHVRSLRESSDKVGQPATQLGGKFECVSVYGEFLRGGLVEHVSR